MLDGCRSRLARLILLDGGLLRSDTGPRSFLWEGGRSLKNYRRRRSHFLSLHNRLQP